MSKYKCECGKTTDYTGNVSIKVIDGQVRHDVKCPCGQYMHLSNPKKGVPSLGNMGRYGRSK